MTCSLYCSRRAFVARAGAALAAGSVAQLLGGCAGITAYRVTPIAGQLRLDLASLPELQVLGGVAVFHAEGDEAPIFIVRQSETTYYALSSVCTHRACTVEPKPGRFVCPCHGSTYSATGSVLRGPAERPLRRMPAELQSDGRTLVVEHSRGTDSR